MPKYRIVLSVGPAGFEHDKEIESAVEAPDPVSAIRNCTTDTVRVDAVDSFSAIGTRIADAPRYTDCYFADQV